MSFLDIFSSQIGVVIFMTITLVIFEVARKFKSDAGSESFEGCLKFSMYFGVIFAFICVLIKQCQES